jgi:hypothetical protein
MGVAEGNFISAFRGYLRMGDFPLDSSSVFESVELAQAYADSNSTAYAGQMIAVVNDTARSVTIYQLGFKVDTGAAGFALQEVQTATSGEFVKSVNGIEPDEDGDVEITLGAEIDSLLDALTVTSTLIASDRRISVPTANISGNDDVITKSYLEGYVETNMLDKNKSTSQTVGGPVLFNAQVTLAQPLSSTVASGTAPMSIISSTLVANLNADKVDGADVETSAGGNVLSVLSDTKIPTSKVVAEYAVPKNLTTLTNTLTYTTSTKDTQKDNVYFYAYDANTGISLPKKIAASKVIRPSTYTVASDSTVSSSEEIKIGDFVYTEEE